MKQQRRYETPVSEILCMMAEDVITLSGINGVNTTDEYITETVIINGKPVDHTYPNPNYRG